MKNNYAVKLESVTKNYGSFNALDSMNLSLEPNKIYGLLGRNGAGKTTMLNVLTGRLFESSGDTAVFGEKVYENINILKQICFIEEKGFYNENIKISQVLKISEGLYPNWDSEYAKALLRLFELDEKKRFKQLSRGMESSLGLIIGLASRAPLTIFDEPSLGLDAVIRERFYNAVIEDFAEHPRTIIISTHLIDEVSRLFEDVVIVDNGRVLLKAESDELKSKAFFLSGKEADVRKAAENAVVMDEEKFGGTLILSVYCNNKIPETQDIEIQPMPMQKLFVNLINPEIYEKLKKGGVIK